MKKMQGVWFCTILLFAVSSCSVSYKLDGGNINYDILKTIQIHDFPNHATLVYPPLSQVFNDGLRTRFIEQTRLRMVSNNPDVEIEGEITGYDISGMAVKEDAYASQTRLTITVRVRYNNNKKPEESIDQSFSAFQEYPSTSSLDSVQDQLIRQIIKDLVDMIFNATAGSW